MREGEKIRHNTIIPSSMLASFPGPTRLAQCHVIYDIIIMGLPLFRVVYNMQYIIMVTHTCMKHIENRQINTQNK